EVPPIGGEPWVARLAEARMADQPGAAVADLDESDRPVVGDRGQHLPRRIRPQVEDPAQRPGPDPPRRPVPGQGRDLDRVLALDIGDEGGLPGGPEDDRFTGADRRVRAQRPGRTLAV